MSENIVDLYDGYSHDSKTDYLYHSKGSERKLIADFCPKVKTVEYIDDEEYWIVIATQNGKIVSEKRVEKNRALKEIESCFDGKCVMEEGCSRWVKRFLQCTRKRAGEKRVYTHTGFKVIDGKRVFLNQGCSVTEKGLTDEYEVRLDKRLSQLRFRNDIEVSIEDCIKFALDDIPEVIDKRIALPLLAYFLMTPLYPLFDEIHQQPRFALYLNGKTQTGKTSIAQLFMNCFGEFNYADRATLSFGDTPNAAEKLVIQADNMVLLLDDQKPSAGVVKADERNKEMSQRVAQWCGDRAVRGRLNDKCKLEDTDTDVLCGILVTGEQGFSNVGESTVGRFVVIDISPDDVKRALLQWLHDNQGCMNKLMSEFIKWCIVHWDDVKKQLGQIIREYTRKDSNRSIMAFAQLLAAYSVFLTFADRIQRTNIKRSTERF